MASFAKIEVLGNLGSDPETKYTPSGTMVVEMRIAHNPRKKSSDREERPAQWYRISAWDQLADRLDKLANQGHLAKGSMLFVEGDLDVRDYQDNKGQNAYSLDVTMTNFRFVGGGQKQGQQQGGQYQQRQTLGNTRQARPADPVSYDDVPF